MEKPLLTFVHISDTHIPADLAQVTGSDPQEAARALVRVVPRDAKRWQRLIDELARLPGVGRKSAQRLAFRLLNTEETDARRLAQAYPDNIHVSDRTIDSHVKNLRRKIAAYLPEREIIQTIYGVGYKLKV